MIGRQLQHGSSCELLLPVGQLILEDFTGEVLTLPDGVIGILNGKVREPVRPAGCKCIVKFSELTYQDRQ